MKLGLVEIDENNDHMRNRSDVEFSTPMQKHVRAEPICGPSLWKQRRGNLRRLQASQSGKKGEF